MADRARLPSGRLSRAYKRGAARDFGTREGERHKLALVNGSTDQSLAASASGILFAHHIIDQEQMNAVLRYRRAHALVYGRVWAQTQDVLHCCDWAGSGPVSDEMIELSERRLEKWNARLTDLQRQQVANLCVFEFLPGWHLAAQLKWRPLPRMRGSGKLIAGLEHPLRRHGYSRSPAAVHRTAQLGGYSERSGRAAAAEGTKQ